MPSREFKSSRRGNRLCENSSPAGDPGKTTSTVSVWRVFFGGEGSENPFFVLPKCHFGVFAQPGEEADFSPNRRLLRLLTRLCENFFLHILNAVAGPGIRSRNMS